jgi:PhnB protein
MSNVKPVPDGYTTVTPYLVVRGAADAITFYKKAFGAQEIMRMPGPGGRIMHAEIKIGNAMLMLAEEAPEMGNKSPQALGGSPVSIFLYVPDVDKTFQQAVSSGAQSKMAPADMFWGDRFSKLTDPYGHEWGIATHKEEVAPAEMAKRQEEFFANMAKQRQGAAT